MQYDMTHLSAAQPNSPERLFLTRERGKAAYNSLAAVVGTLPEDEPLVLSFPPGQLIDASFADEAIIRLHRSLSAGEYGQQTLLLMGLTPDSLYNVNATIYLRNLKLALLVVGPGGEWELAGQLEQSLRETLTMLANDGSMTAPELSERIGSAVNTASNRLKRLYDGRLIRRQHEDTGRGMQYVYHFWKW